MPGVSDSKAPRLAGKRISLRPVMPGDVTDDYVAWMNDPEVNRFMETRFRPQTRQDVAAFVHNMIENEEVYFLAITLNDNGRHVGNIKLALKAGHGTGEISLFIGDKSHWGKGIGTEAIALVRDFGLYELGLVKLNAGCYADNLGSVRAFEKCGFQCEAVLKSEYVSGSRRVDGYRFACFSGDLQ
jgi:RimJ/RimL family protein N-acetyltransferase